MKIALIGDFQESVSAHQAIPISLDLVSKELALTVNFQWLHSSEIEVAALDQYAALWCVPGSPYEHTDNVLRAIEFARTENIPFLGTCGGYQHAALEFARNQLGFTEAENAEIVPDARMPLITGLSCKMYDAESDINLKAGTRICDIYRLDRVSEEYFCGFGVNRAYLNLFEGSGMDFTGFDDDGDPRSLEIAQHAFFIGTAFQPERSAHKGLSHPLVREFVVAAHEQYKNQQ